MHRALFRILLHLLPLPMARNYPQILPKSQYFFGEPRQLGFAPAADRLLRRDRRTLTTYCRYSSGEYDAWDISETNDWTSEKTSLEIKVIDAGRLLRRGREIYQRQLYVVVSEAETDLPIEGATVFLERTGEVDFSDYFLCCEALSLARSILLSRDKVELTTDERGCGILAKSGSVPVLSVPAAHHMRVEARGRVVAEGGFVAGRGQEPLRVEVHLARPATEVHVSTDEATFRIRVLE